MNNLMTKSAMASTGRDTINRLSAPRIFASENPADHASLHAAIFSELQPQTPYEVALAENLVRYEWEIVRMQRFRDSALLATYRSLASSVLATGDPDRTVLGTKLDREKRLLVRDLVSPEATERQDAESDFRDQTDWEPADLVGLAYARSNGARGLDDRIADLERRRRVLREDYERLKGARLRPAAEDAVFVDAENDD